MGGKIFRETIECVWLNITIFYLETAEFYIKYVFMFHSANLYSYLFVLSIFKYVLYFVRHNILEIIL